LISGWWPLGSSETILKADTFRIIYPNSGSEWYSSFRGKDLKKVFAKTDQGLQNRNPALPPSKNAAVTKFFIFFI
jgi:hypothetical protein